MPAVTKIPAPRARTAGRAAAALACAGLFALAAAQYPWETESAPGYESDPPAPASSTPASEDEPSFGSAAEPSFETYDIGPYSSSKDAGGAAADDGPKKKADKPPKEKKPKPARNKRSGPSFSFSSAFSGPQKSCPVCSSVRLKSNQHVDYSGGKIHVCSAACIDRVRRNPAAFADILIKRGEQLATP